MVAGQAEPKTIHPNDVTTLLVNSSITHDAQALKLLVLFKQVFSEKKL